jgi:vacuolar-type H+-ATPase subunit E/Vma4
MPAGAVAALAPVREGLLRRARAEAGQVRADAEAEAAGIEAQGRGQADRILAEARRQGEADAQAVRTAELIRTRRVARGIVLDAQRAAYRQLRRELESELARRYAGPRVRAAVADQIRQLLGAAATVLDAPGGGMLGLVAGRQVDYSVSAVADRAVQALGEVVEGLWTP